MSESESESPCPCMERLCDERACAHMYVRDELFITLNGDFEDDGFDEFFAVLFSYFKCAAAAAADGDVASEKGKTLDDLHCYFMKYGKDIDADFDRAVRVKLFENGTAMEYNSIGQQGWRIYVDRMRKAYKSYAKMVEDGVKHYLEDYKNLPPDVFTDRMADEDRRATQPERWLRRIVRVMLYIMRAYKKGDIYKPAMLRLLTYKIIDVKDDDEFAFRRHCFYYFQMNAEQNEDATIIKRRAMELMADRRRLQRGAVERDA